MRYKLIWCHEININIDLYVQYRRVNRQNKKMTTKEQETMTKNIIKDKDNDKGGWYGYNNKREDCMIRKEVWFISEELKVLLLLSFLLLIFIVRIYICCFSISSCSFRRHCHDYSLVIFLFLPCFVVVVVLISSTALSFYSSFIYSFHAFLYFKILIWVIHFVR